MSTLVTAPLAYPGRVVRRGHKNKTHVLAVQRALNEMGVGPVEEEGGFGDQTEDAVMLFQARFPDTDGLPLKVDGEVGPLTWAALFGPQSVQVRNETTIELLSRAVAAAASQVGVMEEPRGSNRGPKVDQYVQATGLSPADKSPWCACFVFWCYNQAAEALGRKNPVVRTAHVLTHWREAGGKGVPRITTKQAKDNPGLVRPGHIFIMAVGGRGAGHTGIVERMMGGKLVTIEGNTNRNGSREGIGVFRRELRKIADINRGFIDYGEM